MAYIKQHPVRLGLTGGIGSGKSTVGSMLAYMGAALIDADAIARQATAPQGAAINAIRTAFGDVYIDTSGALDRSRMRELVFSQPDARARLEAIVHPLVTLQTHTEMQKALAAGHRVVVYDIPLLTESGRWARTLDAVLVVDCDEEIQVERVVRRSGLTPIEVRSIIASQATRQARRSIADGVIHNGGAETLGALQAQVRQIAQQFGL